MMGKLHDRIIYDFSPRPYSKPSKRRRMASSLNLICSVETTLLIMLQVKFRKNKFANTRKSMAWASKQVIMFGSGPTGALEIKRLRV
ncbi:hypothetical protein M413DRAFT_449881 [Hebeloma cylindrosporum]|uniref:Uncharacterized protein n=1 Tax=Hebeloma cylindrosporum TaxID=76867 RepID=A0A0C3BEH6_HEBCY|nr:hypothetical protein M413DRAFT_449881 [Hebeloma cylindrosporum h7]